MIDPLIRKSDSLKLLNCKVNNFPPLLEGPEDEEFEQFLSTLDKEPEEAEKDPDEEEFAINDRFIRDFEDVDDMATF